MIRMRVTRTSITRSIGHAVRGAGGLGAKAGSRLTRAFDVITLREYRREMDDAMDSMATVIERHEHRLSALERDGNTDGEK